MTPTPTRAGIRHCIKCGREVGPDETICSVCNRAGMATPSATQYHGTIVVAVVLAVAALAVAASLSLRGVGPYAAEVGAVADVRPIGFEVTFSVTNEGSNAGRAKCQLVAVDAVGQRLRARNVVTEQIPGGSSVEASTTLPDLDDAPADVTITCS
jgi:predicted nucleic acid-binding Zn ribbon protein